MAVVAMLRVAEQDLHEADVDAVLDQPWLRSEWRRACGVTPALDACRCGRRRRRYATARVC